MDTKTLVVGQDVYMFSAGLYVEKGRVVAITPEGVDVQTGVMQNDGTHELMHFDKDGKETYASRRRRLGFGPSPESKFHTALWQFAPECQPYELDDMPFAERTAVFKQKWSKEAWLLWEQRNVQP